MESHVSRSRLLWNSLPGGLYALPQYSADPAQFPFYYAVLGEAPSFKVTVSNEDFILRAWPQNNFSEVTFSRAHKIIEPSFCINPFAPFKWGLIEIKLQRSGPQTANFNLRLSSEPRRLFFISLRWNMGRCLELHHTSEGTHLSMFSSRLLRFSTFKYTSCFQHIKKAGRKNLDQVGNSNEHLSF